MFEIFLYLVVLTTAHSAVLTDKLAFDLITTPLRAQQDGRIVGGRECSIIKHPHQISMRHRSCTTCTYSHTCGGSVYDKQTIVTAAHCVSGRKAENFLIVAGTENRNGADGVVARVEKIVMHENYNFFLTDNDVAVMFLSTPLPIDNLTIAAIPLADVRPDNGVMSHVTGWGTTAEGGYSANKLLEVEVPIVSNDRCNQAYGEGRITDSMLCAGAVNGGKDACQGDSGGPLIVNGKLTGIVSWGRGCARPDYPGVYANVAYLKSWIVNAVTKNYQRNFFM